MFRKKKEFSPIIVSIGNVLLAKDGSAYRVDHNCIKQLPVVPLGKEGPDGE